MSSAKEPPRILGRFEVGVRVGGGGMADVYVGRSTEDDELVAIKVMREELGNDPKYMRMFSDEAKLLALLSHPNLIRTIEYGIARERRYLVMELLAGRSLADVWDALVEKKEKLPLRLGAWLCGRVADGLHAAHELVDPRGEPMSVVHRDVNPSNIFLTHSGDVKLIDFGLAKARVRRSQTTRGIIKGKVPYIAPEQFREATIDRRVDLFALGTTLWELGTMKRLFKRDNDLATIRAIGECKVPDPRTLLPDYPDGLYAVVLTALQKDPDARYATAATMRDDLDDYVGNADGLKDELAALVTRLFPGEAARHASWKRDAKKTEVLATIAPPPTRVPVSAAEPDETALDDSDIIEVT